MLKNRHADKTKSKIMPRYGFKNNVNQDTKVLTKYADTPIVRPIEIGETDTVSPLYRKEIRQCPRPLSPVSYTHLDVYKRQTTPIMSGLAMPTSPSNQF